GGEGDEGGEVAGRLQAAAAVTTDTSQTRTHIRRWRPSTCTFRVSLWRDHYCHRAAQYEPGTSAVLCPMQVPLDGVGQADRRPADRHPPGRGAAHTPPAGRR